MEFKDRLKALRLERNCTLAQVAKAIHLTVSAYSNYEQGIREPSLEIIKRICKYFDVTADYLLGLEDTPNVRE